jgi:uncharacterized BrkB/YihY/UPF0761 family membrane protein
MKASLLWLLFCIAIFYFGAVLYAIYRGRGFKALLKVPFATFSFETEDISDKKKRTPKRE